MSPGDVIDHWQAGRLAEIMLKLKESGSISTKKQEAKQLPFIFFPFFLGSTMSLPCWELGWGEAIHRMAILCSISPSPSTSYPHLTLSSSLPRSFCNWPQSSCRRLLKPIAATHLCPEETHHRIDKSLVKISEAVAEDELWAAACLRVRTFYDFDPTTFRVQVSTPPIPLLTILSNSLSLMGNYDAFAGRCNRFRRIIGFRDFISLHRRSDLVWISCWSYFGFRNEFSSRNWVGGIGKNVSLCFFVRKMRCHACVILRYLAQSQASSEISRQILTALRWEHRAALAKYFNVKWTKFEEIVSGNGSKKSFSLDQNTENMAFSGWSSVELI